MQIRNGMLVFNNETEGCQHSHSKENDTVNAESGHAFGEVFNLSPGYETVFAGELADELIKFKNAGGEFAMRPEILFQDECGRHHALAKARIIPSRSKDVPVQVMLGDSYPDLKVVVLVRTNRFPDAFNHSPEANRKKHLDWEKEKHRYYINIYGNFVRYETDKDDITAMPEMDAAKVFTCIDRHLSRFGEEFHVADCDEITDLDSYDSQVDAVFRSPNREIRFEVVPLFDEDTASEIRFEQYMDLKDRFSMKYFWLMTDHQERDG